MTITKTLEIPANRWLAIEVPAEAKPPKLRLAKSELDEILRNAQTPISDSLTGILAHLGDISAEEIREERLAKHLR